MNFELTEEQQMIKKMVGEFAREVIMPAAAELDEKSRFPAEIIKQIAELGLMGVAIPEEYGGAGMDNVSYVIAIEEISRACASTGVIVSVNNSLVCDPIYQHGTEEQKREYLTPLARGEKLGCYCLTESEAGSDPASMSTAAALDGDHWVLNGRKVFVTNGREADVCLVFATADRSKGRKGINAYLVDKGSPGLSVGKVEKKLGINASSTAELIFEDCRIPRRNLLSEEGRGFRIAMETLDGGRIGIAAQALGIARACLEESIKYSKEREQFGKPICENQAIQWMLADMATEIDAARLLTYLAAHLKDKGTRYYKEASMAKLFASETAMRAAIKAVQIHGGYGYVKDYPVERYMRDAKITEIYEGTSEIQRMIIASHILR